MTDILACHKPTLSLFEYVGDDFEADMEKMARDPKTIEWWSVCKPLQDPLEARQPKEWWATMREIFYTA